MSNGQINMDFGPNYEELDIIGRSERINEVVTIIKTIAPTDISVLIAGESGTGKEIFANLIHKLSDRKNEKFIPINCGAIPEGLIESELFGHEKGSFTSASDKRKGYFESANNGTILLDEISELPLPSQVKLLRVLENGTFMRVGGSTNIKVDVRIIAASNKDLARMVDKGTFREDLYFRLKAVSLELPSLRERLEDIPQFVELFAKNSAEKHKRSQLNFDRDAILEIVNHPWKGNIRELKNFIDMLTVMETGKIIIGSTVRKYLKGKPNTSHLPVKFERLGEENERELIFRTLLEIKNDINLIKRYLFSTGKKEIISDYSIEEALERLDPNQAIITPYEHGDREKKEIIDLLKKYRGNRRKTAEEMNISERTLYRKITKHGIEL
ncbi:MAG: sigma-54 dependent transcriptional regulator [Candidatus Delongbacteria bacterium]|jgi:transcriptional regulator with PAS, ATPase and Fis domain|nr:sigma-54 dependent transcriptional regulator [Candidatus Delongbacteria bacterium]